jgi:hypothetical protein
MSSPIRAWWVGIVVLSVAACSGGEAAFRPLDVAGLNRSGPRTVTAAISYMPPFVVESQGMYLIGGGRLGPLIASSVIAQQEAGKLAALREAGVEDPAAVVRGILVSALVQHLGLKESNRGPFFTTATAPEAIAGDYRGADLVVDFRTVRWGLRATRSNHLWLDYLGRLRLIDGRSGAVVAEGSCSTPGPDSDEVEPPVYLAWAFEDGAMLKGELWHTANRCADDFLARVLRLP